MSVNDEFDLDSELSGVDIALDPEEDRENWPVIHIEMEDEKPNYEYLAAHGTMQNGQPFGHELQVMREVDVAVPPSIVYSLRDAISSHYSQRRDASGKTSLIKQERSAIPWRLVSPGLHVKPPRAR